jgi:endonuclease IV
MIFISSTCSKQKKIGKAVLELVKHGFNNIELSGGTEYYEGYEDDLLNLKEKYKINYLLHNYFPPPKEPFVINLASLDNATFEKSLSHLCDAIRLTRLLGGDKFGFHAGFYIDMSINELGKKVSYDINSNRRRVYQKFCDGFNLIKKESNGIALYIENNAYSKVNYELYGLKPPFMLTSPNEYFELKKNIEFNLLLDLGHLYISSSSFCLNFNSCLDQLSKETDYIHLSNNNGFFDENRGFDSNSKLLNKLRKIHLDNKIITLEIYEGIDVLKSSVNRITEMTI